MKTTTEPRNATLLATALEKKRRHSERSSGRLCDRNGVEESLKVTGGGGWESCALSPRRLRPLLSAILHCVSPTAFARGETPFRMTVGFFGATARCAAVFVMLAWLSSTPAFGVGAGVSAEQKQKEMEEEVTRAANAPKADLTKLQCGNLVYAGTKSSICFADKFLSDVAANTNLNVGKNFVPVRLDADNVFDFPFCVWSGEADFSLTKKERDNLRKYLLNGGFILSSPGCSDPNWDTALRKELKLIFPEYKMVKLPMSHPVFSTVNQVTRLTDKHGGQAYVEGMEVNGRLVMVYSKDGLNDVSNAKGCCCCGGNMIVEAVLVNVNVFTYALLY